MFGVDMTCIWRKLFYTQLYDLPSTDKKKRWERLMMWKGVWLEDVRKCTASVVYCRFGWFCHAVWKSTRRRTCSSSSRTARSGRCDGCGRPQTRPCSQSSGQYGLPQLKQENTKKVIDLCIYPGLTMPLHSGLRCFPNENSPLECLSTHYKKKNTSGLFKL